MNSSKVVITASAAGLRLSPTLEINELVQKTRASGKKVIHLGFGEATFPIQQDVLKCHSHNSGSSSYMPVNGLEALRESIAKYQSARLGVLIEADQVVVAPGSKPLLFALFNVLDGDVLLPRPSWVSYEPQVAHAGKKLFWIETDDHDRHTLTIDALNTAYNSAVNARCSPRIMLINSPSNPTGRVFSEEQTSMLVKFCQERSLILISDEIYSDICFSSEKANVSAYQLAHRGGGSVIMTGGLSKTYSAGGWRVGFAIFPKSNTGKMVQHAVTAYASECWSAASSSAQMASVVAFSSAKTTSEAVGFSMDQYRMAVTCLHKHCTLRLYRALKDCGLEIAEPEGAFYLYPSFRPYLPQLQRLGISTSRQLAKWLIEECGIATLPGSAFGEIEETAGSNGGNFRLRLATSWLYFPVEEKYIKGYSMLDRAATGDDIELPLLEEAIAGFQEAVRKLNIS